MQIAKKATRKLYLHSRKLNLISKDNILPEFGGCPVNAVEPGGLPAHGEEGGARAGDQSARPIPTARLNKILMKISLFFSVLDLQRF